MAIWSPTGYRWLDSLTRAVLVACIITSVILMYNLRISPSPINMSLRIVQYLMEEDATACKQQNTKENRELKHAKI